MGKLNINNGGVDTNKVMPSIDERFGPYASLEAVEAEFGKEGRDAKCAGLTVGVTQSDGSVKEYCYQPSASDPSVLELVEKKPEVKDANVFGYYNANDWQFYKDSSFTVAITGDEATIYIDLDSNVMYRYDASGNMFVLLNDSAGDKKVEGSATTGRYVKVEGNVGDYAEITTHGNSDFRYYTLPLRKGETVQYKTTDRATTYPFAAYVDKDGRIEFKDNTNQGDLLLGEYTAQSDGIFYLNNKKVVNDTFDDCYIYVIRSSADKKVNGIMTPKMYKRTQSTVGQYAEYSLGPNNDWRYLSLSIRKGETAYYKTIGHYGGVEPLSFADNSGVLRYKIDTPSSYDGGDPHEGSYMAEYDGVMIVNVRHDDSNGWDDAYLYVIRTSSGSAVSDERVSQIAERVDGLQGKNGIYMKEAEMSEGDSINLANLFPQMNKFGNTIQLTCRVGTLGTLKFWFGATGDTVDDSFDYRLVTIDDTNIKLYKLTSTSTLLDTVAHGLTIDEYISVNMNCLDDGTMKVSINTLDDMADATLGHWDYGVGRIKFELADSAALSDVQLSVTNDMFRCPLWLFGASQEGIKDIRYVGQLKNMGYLNCLVNARSGRNSEGILEDLKRALKFGQPKYVYFGLSNDGISEYLSRMNNAIDFCKENDIEIILVAKAVHPYTTASAGTVSEQQAKRTAILESGCRVFDFGKAVSADPDSENGIYTYGDNQHYLDASYVHPTNAQQAHAIALQFLADVPEIMQYGVKSAEITVDTEIKQGGTDPVTGGAIYTALSGKADKSEMSVTDGIGANADKTTIQLKNGTSATVLKQHQSLAGYVQRSGNYTENNFASFDSNGGLQDSGKNATDFATAAQGTKADTALQPTGVKTINNQSIVGSGNITIEGGGTDDYADLSNKPQINSIVLSGNKSTSDLGLATSEQGTKADTALQPSALNSYVQKSATAGLLKNDGTVDTTTAGKAASALQPKQSGQYTQGDIVVFDANGGLVDSQKKTTDFATAAQGTKADSSVQNITRGGNTLTKTNGVVDVPAEIQDVAATQVAAGGNPTVNLTNGVLTFGIPIGADGQDGADAVNPFKGWWPDLATLKAAHTATAGDSAYVKDASPATTWSIYVYNSTASSNGYWADSGLDADTSHAQTFASGEELNEVHLVNDLTTGGTGDVLSAEQGVVLAGQVGIIVSKIYTTVTLIVSALKKAVYNSNDVEAIISAIEQELSGDILYIDAVYTQSEDVYVGQSLDDLKSDLVVTAHYMDGTSSEVSAYVLSGTLSAGQSTISVSYGGKNTSFPVTVLPALYYRENKFYYKGGLTATSIQSGLSHITVDGITYVYTQKGSTALDQRACYFYFDLALTPGVTYNYKFYYSGLPSGVTLKLGIQGMKQSFWDDGVANTYVNHTNDILDSGWLFPTVSDGIISQNLENPALSVGVRFVFMAMDSGGNGVEWPSSLKIDRFAINPV